MNKSKAKGTAFETDTVNFLNEKPYDLQFARLTLSGKFDKGDLASHLAPSWTTECKNHKEIDLATWMREAELEAINRGTWRYVVIHKRRGKGIRDAYVTMPLWAFREILNNEAKNASA